VRFCDVAGFDSACGQPDIAAALVELNDGALGVIAGIRAKAATRDLPIIGFLSHVDRDLARRAEAEGVTQVMPRSQFSETLPDLLMDLLAPGTKREVQEEPELPDE
jgi:hypothetical protein